MALDQFKTQVLLLHSEQSTLDSLSSGFSDSYTVHCATSGSEALNTLVETPINVIVSAQNLPGMSGLEALREAKKRSPDTVGILLAGNADDGLEALVGDQEVFQVVRGNVTGATILKLVDNATRQMRLMALAESANDTAAIPDEPAEHIVMETSENGSTIISGSTGRMPVLDPGKVSVAASVGSQSVDVLVLTKDQEFLTTIRESSRGMHTVHYANTLAQADEMIRQNKVGVAVVDAAMVGPKVEQLTLHLRKGSPRLVSIVAGRRDDGEMLMDLINRGKVYRFLLKPVSPGRARLAVEASVKHHLEAPDAAFKISGKAGARPQPSPKAAARQKASPAAAPKAKTPAKPAPAQPAPRKVAKAAPAARPAPIDPPLGDPLADSPITEGLSSAFGDGEDTSFTETVTGLLSSVTDKFKRDKVDTSPEPEGTVMELPTRVPASASGGSLVRNPKVIGIGAVAVVAIAAAVFWIAGGDEEAAVVAEPVATTSSPSITAPDADLDAQTGNGANVDALVAEARLARDAGQIFNPAGSNAIELYADAANANPSNAILAAELDAVVAQALAMAEAALLEGRLNDAEAALTRVALVDANNGRLPFLTAQLWQMQLRNHLANARAAIRDNRFEDAGNAVAAAMALNVADTGEIEAITRELREARSEHSEDGTLALAAARLQEGALLSPPNNNARYYYDLVLSNDPENSAARQGLGVIANRLVLQARSEMDAGNLDAAERFLSDARAVDASNANLAATDGALSNARSAIANRERRATEQRQQEEADRQARLDQEEADRQARLDQEEADRQARLDQEEADRLAALAAAEAAEQAEAIDKAAEVSAPAKAAVQEPEPEPVPVQARAQSPVPVSSLTRTRYVAPKYPRGAERRNQSGWVDIVFTVAMDGSVKDLEIRGSKPDGVFDNAALRAVEKWTFEPILENGVLVEKRAGVRMLFALE